MADPDLDSGKKSDPDAVKGPGPETLYIRSTFLSLYYEYVFVNFKMVQVLFLVYFICLSTQKQSGSASFHADPGGLS